MKNLQQVAVDKSTEAFDDIRSARDCFAHLARMLESEPHRTAGVTATYQFEIDGPRGGNFYVEIINGDAKVGEGSHGNPSVTIGMIDDDYIAMCTKQISGSELFIMGRMRVRGDASLGMKAEKMFS